MVKDVIFVAFNVEW